MKAFFITGTGTGIGKTFVTAVLAEAASKKGLRTAVMKPIQTGMENPESGDLGEIRRFAPGIMDIPYNIACPYCLRFESSPHLAARKESVSIDFKKIKSAFDTIRETWTPDMILVEGAGGICVPVTETLLTTDLIKYLGIPAIIIATAGLGTINHTLLTVSELKRASVPIAGIIINQVSVPTLELELDNIEMIGKLSGCRILGTIPFASGGNRKSLAGHLNIDGLMNS